MNAAHCPYCGGGAVDLLGHIENCVMQPNSRRRDHIGRGPDPSAGPGGRDGADESDRAGS